MTAKIWFLEEPWGLVNGRGISFELLKCSKRDPIESKTLYRLLAVPDGVSVSVGDSHFPPGEQSAVFTRQGQSYRTLLLPLGQLKESGGSADIQIKLRHKNENFEFTLHSNIIQGTDKIKSFLRWQIDCFQQMIELSDDRLPDECSVGSGIRRSWRHVRKVWLKDGENEKNARISLIVRMAQDKHLINALKAILIHPNKVLKRQRTLVNVASASQMDPACLRWYIRQPGRTTQEKAGTKQQILAVTRVESYNVLENRLSHWVANRLLKLSNAFFNDNRLHTHSDKYNLVKNLSFITKSNLNSSPIREVPMLGHCHQPNYPLMHHHQYKQIWSAYLKLRKEERLEEDCWRWQSTFWIESARQILAGILTSISLHSSHFVEEASSMLYVNCEQMNGLWTKSPVVPGPFKTSKGRVDFIDLRDGSPDKKISEWMGLVGCHQILRQKRIDGTMKILVIWFWHQYELEEHLQNILQGCQDALIKSLHLLDKNVEVAGLVIASEVCNENFFYKKIETWTSSLTIIKLPKNFHPELNTLLSKFEEVLRVFN
jgi:Domain of unknown function (DUF2357)